MKMNMLSITFSQVGARFFRFFSDLFFLPALTSNQLTHSQMKQRNTDKKNTATAAATTTPAEEKAAGATPEKTMSEAEMVNTVLIGAFTILFLPLIVLLVVYQVCSRKFEMEFSHSLIAGAVGAIMTAFIGQLRFVFRIM